MAIPTFTVGEVLTAALVNSWLVPLAAYKTATQSVTASTTLVNDSDLKVSVEANAVYVVELGLTYTADTAGDLKTGWTTPAGATIAEALCIGLNSTAAAATDDITVGSSSGPTLGGLGAGSNAALLFKYLLTVSSTAGTLQFQFAQGTSSGTATTLNAGCYLIAQRVG